jgi:putative glutamine amidotransferase
LFNVAMRPKIGITCGFMANGKGTGHSITLPRTYVDAVRMVGGRPVLIPPVTTREELDEILSELDGLLLSGGPDVRPDRYGKPKHPQTVVMHERREFVDFECLRWADERNLPTLAICLGVQELNVHRGGTLYQHVPEQVIAVPSVRHRGVDGSTHHDVAIESDSRLCRIAGRQSIEVNSSHHQAVLEVGRDLRPVAWSPDGLVEALEDPRRRFMLGVQWHPEGMTDREPHRALFAAMVKAAGQSR